MSAEQDPSKSQLQAKSQTQESPDVPEDEGFQRAKRLDPGTPEPGEEIQINLKKFSLYLGAILIFAVIATMFKQFISGG
jgi:hypothetical protein